MAKVFLTTKINIVFTVWTIGVTKWVIFVPENKNMHNNKLFEMSFENESAVKTKVVFCLVLLLFQVLSNWMYKRVCYKEKAIKPCKL